MKGGNLLRTVVFSAAFLLFLGATAPLPPAMAEETTLNIGMANRPGTLNYFASTDLWSRRVLRLIHMPLYVLGPEDGRVIPWLAAGPPEAGENPNEVIIRLREAEWEDGTKVSAEDLAFTVKVIQEFRVPGLVERWRDVAEVLVLDPKTIRFRISPPAHDFFEGAILSGFVQKGKWQEAVHAARKSPDGLQTLLSHDPGQTMGNGPFCLSTHGRPYFLVLKRNPRFFAPRQAMGGVLRSPALQGLMIHMYEDPERMLAEFRKGRLEFLWSDLSPHHAEELAKIPEVAIYRTPRTGYEYLGFNLERKPYGDPAFREAVSDLVDRQKMIQHLLEGHGVPVITVVPPQNTFWCNRQIRDDSAGLNPHERVLRARSILQAAGYRWDAGKLLLPDGTAMRPMEIMTTGSGSGFYRMKVAMALKKDLFKLGVTVRLVTMDLNPLLAQLRRGDFDAYLLGWASLRSDPGYLRTFFHSSEARAGGKNYPRFCSAAFDRLADAASQEPDRGKRRQIVCEMQALLARERPVIPLFVTKRVEATRRDAFRGWVPLPEGIGNLWSFLNLEPVPKGQDGGR
jgi:peptide/nickel transport system substrate-binding protein